MVNSTIRFYDEKAQEFYENTINSDMKDHYAIFEKHLRFGARILDAGCGSGRDSRYFIDRGYFVEAFDASEEMVKMSSDLTGIDVKHATFENIQYSGVFDAIWACASLLHVSKAGIAVTISRLANMLANNGIFYMSYKYGDTEFTRDGRDFNCYTENSFRELLKCIPDLSEEIIYITADVREGRQDERWLNVLLRKSL